MPGHGGHPRSCAARGSRGRGQRSLVGERERREELSGAGERGPFSHGGGGGCGKGGVAAAAGNRVKALVPCCNTENRNPSYSNGYKI
jgi:hypothetical protein